MNTDEITLNKTKKANHKDTKILILQKIKIKTKQKRKKAKQKGRKIAQKYFLKNSN